MIAGWRWPIILLFCCWSASSWAVLPDEQLADPALEARARNLSQEIRCLVCQNQSIDDSNADLARDLRVLVRDRLKAGDSDAGVRQFLVDRYGPYVLLKPPFSWATALLWLGPFAILFIAVAGLILATRRKQPPTADQQSPPLTSAEEAALRQLLTPDAPKD